MTLISQESEALIVSSEIGSRKDYEARYFRPEWPQGQSGITIGIGYDVGAGVKDKQQLHADWDGHIPAPMIKALEPCIGVTDERAHDMLAKVRPLVSVSWDAAMTVFETVDIPRWYGICKATLPNFDELPPDCRGALVSLAYNRGSSFRLQGARYSEMRLIRTAMIDKTFKAIPAAFRSMKRLWQTPSVRGLVIRREHEAQLFEKGLAMMSGNTGAIA